MKSSSNLCHLLLTAALFTGVTGFGEIKRGMTREQVTNELGFPDSRSSVGRLETLIYKNGTRITLMDGKVDEVRVPAQPEATPAPSAGSAAPAVRSVTTAPKTSPTAEPKLTSGPAASAAEATVALAALKVDGHFTFRGKSIPLKTACAEWKTRRNCVSLYLFPFDLTPADVALLQKQAYWPPPKMVKPSPDPAVWKLPPHVRIHMCFDPSTTTFSTETLTGAKLEVSGWEQPGATSQFPGHDADFQKGVQSISLPGTNLQAAVTFSVKAASDKHHYELEVAGKSLILNHWTLP
jgi:hypothetical protein